MSTTVSSSINDAHQPLSLNNGVQKQDHQQSQKHRIDLHFHRQKNQLESLFGPFFLKEVDLDAVRADGNWRSGAEVDLVENYSSDAKTSVGTESEEKQDRESFQQFEFPTTSPPTAFPSIAVFTNQQDEKAKDRRSAQIDCLLKACLLRGYLTVPDYFFIQYDCPRKVVGDGVFLEQRYRGFDLLFEKFLASSHFAGRADAEASASLLQLDLKADYRDLLREGKSDETDPDDVTMATTLDSSAGGDDGTSARRRISSPRDRQQLHTASPFGVFYERHFESCLQLVSEQQDRWQTAFEAFQPLVDALYPGKEQRKSVRVWQPFYSDGECKSHLERLGFQTVFHDREKDFFEVCSTAASWIEKSVDLILDNPPWTTLKMKKRILRAMVTLNKPFCLLTPTNFLQGPLLRSELGIFHGLGSEGKESSSRSTVQVLLPTKVPAIPVVNITSSIMHDRKKDKDQDVDVSATKRKVIQCKNLAWLCFRMNLPKDLYFI
ncbi:unnamed protein product [Amoebophrya sp. A120]|nr:unnamed protein product [Amoebophrya sp. A120]|eukprot:GSA120T00007862001.1